MPESPTFLDGRLLVVAFEGWNDAGDAASGVVRILRDNLPVAPLAEIDPELYFDYQFSRPVTSLDENGETRILWPGVTLFGPPAGMADGASLAEDADLRVSGANASNILLLLGTEPSRSWKSFVAEVLDQALTAGVSGIVFLGAMLADVPHTRPISVFASSPNPEVRAELDVERSTYEGPIGILGVLGQAAEQVGIPTLSIWASVPHYVHSSPSPKATLALIDRLEEIIDVVIPRGDLVAEAEAWQDGIDDLASEDETMAEYIRELERAKDAVDAPEASGEAIAKEFERYLRRRGDGRPDGRGPNGPGPAAPGGPDDSPWRDR